MAPSIPTYRPWITAARAALATLAVALLGSLLLVLTAPAEELRAAETLLCALQIRPC
ncbi:MAG: hypothetical protein OEY03_03840 [Rhizobacter sp.]|nr:hypothetical protein [Rhizobacter sp.]